MKTSEATKILSRLLSAFPEVNTDEGTRLDRLRGYATAVEGLSYGVLCEAERRILAGRAADIDPRFMPTPPQLAKLCRAVSAEAFQANRVPEPMRLERFEAPSDPKIAAKLESLQKTLAAQAAIARHESRQEWLDRMGDRILRRPLERKTG